MPRTFFVKEKVDLSGNINLRGNIIMRSYKENILVNHVVGYIFTGIGNNKGVQKVTNLFDTYFDIEDRLYDDPLFKGYKEIIKAINAHSTNNPFYLELDFENNF